MVKCTLNTHILIYQVSVMGWCWLSNWCPVVLGLNAVHSAEAPCNSCINTMLLELVELFQTHSVSSPLCSG